MIELTIQSESMMKMTQGETCVVPWAYTGIEARDISIGTEGDMYVIGTDDKVYYYDYVKEMYIPVITPTELIMPTAIAVDDKGTPYVIANCGQMFFLSERNDWVRLPGCATDIAIGRGFEIWKIGCESFPKGGYAISKLLCDKQDLRNVNQYFRYKSYDYLFQIKGTIPYLKDKVEDICYWNNIEGEGIRIDVSPEGYPYVIAPGGMVMKYEDNNWVGIYNQLAQDLSVSNDGVLFIVEQSGLIYRSISEELGSWQQLSGKASNIASGPYSEPVITSSIYGHVEVASKIIDQ